MKKRVCFLDVDGVLADFSRQAREMCHVDSHIFKDRPDCELTSSEKISQQKLFYFCDCVDDFWKTMKPTKNASFLYNYCAQHFDEVHFLSGFCPSPEYATRFDKVKTIKENWIRQNIRGIRDSSKIIVTPLGKKHFVDPMVDSFLIDDMKKNIISWQKVGGKGILYSNDREVIRAIYTIVNTHSVHLLPLNTQSKSY